MSLVNPYCTLEHVQRETGNSDGELEVWFEECINGASRWIDEHCNRDFLPHDYTSSYYTVQSGEVVGDLICLRWPILTLTEVKVGDMPVVSSQYFFDTGSRTIRTIDGTHWGQGRNDRFYTDQPQNPQLSSGQNSFLTVVAARRPITIKGTFGHTTPPAAVRTACAKIASAWSHEKRRERVDLGGGRVSLLDERIPDDALALLKRYRRLIH